MSNRENFKAIIFFAFILWLIPQRAYAYIDPGTGSYIFQIAIATAIGLFFSIKVFGRSVKDYFVNTFLKSQKGEKKNDG